MTWSKIVSKSSTLSAEEKERQKVAFENHIAEHEEKHRRESPILYKIAHTGLGRRDVIEKTFENFTPKKGNKRAFELMSGWNPDEVDFGYMLIGPVGTGKTHLMKAVLIKWASKEFPCRLISMSSILDRVRDKTATFGDVLKELEAPEVLAIDDFGAEKATDWAQEKFLTILERRIHLDKFNFITSNLTLEDLKDVYDLRILDRLKEIVVFQKVEGDTHRGEIFNRNVAKAVKRSL